MSEDRGVLSRWSQRKAAARRGEMPAEQATAPSDDTAAVTPDDAAVDDTPVLPPIEKLTAQSDFTAFLGEKVPEHLRRAALRKLWSSDPVFANLDGLNHYDEDYNLIDTTITAAQTAYRAGIGYLEEIEDTVDRIEDAFGAPSAEKIESTELADAERCGISSPNQSGTGDKSNDAPQQEAPSSAPADSRLTPRK